jgi:hypothetical protein
LRWISIVAIIEIVAIIAISAIIEIVAIVVIAAIPPRLGWRFKQSISNNQRADDKDANDGD